MGWFYSPPECSTSPSRILRSASNIKNNIKTRTGDRNNWKTAVTRKPFTCTQQLSQQADPEVDSLSDTEAGGASSTTTTSSSAPLFEALSPVQAAAILAASLSTDGHADCHHHRRRHHQRKRLSRNHIQIKTGNARSFKSYQFATSAFYRNASRVRLPVFWSSAADLLFGASPLPRSSSPDQRGKTHNDQRTYRHTRLARARRRNNARPSTTVHKLAEPLAEKLTLSLQNVFGKSNFFLKFRSKKMLSSSP